MSREIERLIDTYIDNLYSYEDNFDEDTIFNKQKELELIAETDTVNSAQRLRPYVGVIKSIKVVNSNYEIQETENSAISIVNLTVRTLSETYDGKTSQVEDTEELRVERTIKSDYFISTLSSDTQIIYSTYMDTEDEYYTELRVSEDVYYDIMMGETLLPNLYYMYKGYPMKDPFVNDTKQYPCDSFNLLYWLYKNKEVELEYPLRSDDVLNNDNFKTVLKKGHKYKDDISKINEGDIIFFGMNDNNIGIYMGDNKFFSIIGEFPMDSEQRPEKFDLLEYWEVFNGRVLRYKDPLFDYNVEGV